MRHHQYWQTSVKMAEAFPDAPPRHQVRRPNVQPNLELKRQLAGTDKLIEVKGEHDQLYLMMNDSEENRAKEKPSSVTNRVFVGKALGHGGFGIVYKAQMSGSEDICIKMARHRRRYITDGERSKEQRKINQSLLKEVEQYRKLSEQRHQNFLAMKFYGESRGLQEGFLVIEYYQGLDLSRLIKHYRPPPLPPKLRYKVIHECAQAVQHLLSLEIVHCDIKPANIVFSVGQPLKLIDFGCAFDLKMKFGLKSHADKSNTPGTPEYMPPEMIVDGIPGEASDMYSLGCLLFNIITQRAPWYHLDEVKAAWQERDRSKARELIEQQHQKFNEDIEASDDVTHAATALQTILLGMQKAGETLLNDELTLISGMLSFHRLDRPSCADVISRVNAMKNEWRHQSAHIEAGIEVLPTTIPHSGADSTGEPSATLSSDAETRLAGVASLTDEVEDLSEYGPPSDFSQLTEDVREEYSVARLDEREAMSLRYDEMLQLLEEQYRIVQRVGGTFSIAVAKQKLQLLKQLQSEEKQ